MEPKKKLNPMFPGIALGLAIGTGIGVALKNIALGIAIGVTVGSILSVGMYQKNKREGNGK